MMAIVNLFILPHIFQSTAVAAVDFSANTTFLDEPLPPTTTPRAQQPHTSDWISYLLALGLSHLPFEVDVPLWSRQISLGLVGVIILSSIQYVMRSISRALKLGSASVGGVVLLLGLAQLMVRSELSLSLSLSFVIVD